MQLVLKNKLSKVQLKKKKKRLKAEQSIQKLRQYQIA